MDLRTGSSSLVFWSDKMKQKQLRSYFSQHGKQFLHWILEDFKCNSISHLLWQMKNPTHYWSQSSQLTTYEPTDILGSQLWVKTTGQRIIRLLLAPLATQMSEARIIRERTVIHYVSLMQDRTSFHHALTTAYMRYGKLSCWISARSVTPSPL